MKLKLLFAGIALAALTTGAAVAQGYSDDPDAPPPPHWRHHHRHVDPHAAMPISTSTGRPDENVADTPPTLSPDVETAHRQPPLDQTPGNTPAQPPASNQSVTVDTPGPLAR